MSRRYVHRIPFIVKLNHNDFLNYPNTYDQVMFGSVRQAADLGAVGVGATIYYGSEFADRQIVEVSNAFAEAHRHGMFTVLWTYLRNPAFKQGDTDYHLSADLTGQANHLGVTIEADIIKQKQAENNGGYNALKFGTHRSARLQPADHRQSDRPDTLAGGQLLRRANPDDQLGRRLERCGRPGRRSPDRGHQQAGGRIRPHRGAQVLLPSD